MLRHISIKKKEDYPKNPYRYNLKGSSLKPPMAPFLPKKVQPDEIKEKITKLEEISKACVSTVGEGIDAYWMMSKDLENKVNDVDSRMETLTKIVIEMAEEKKKILEILQEQHATIIDLSSRFA